jgi:hypothetical protein
VNEIREGSYVLYVLVLQFLLLLPGDIICNAILLLLLMLLIRIYYRFG